MDTLREYRQTLIEFLFRKLSPLQLQQVEASNDATSLTDIDAGTASFTSSPARRQLKANAIAVVTQELMKKKIQVHGLKDAQDRPEKHDLSSRDYKFQAADAVEFATFNRKALP